MPADAEEVQEIGRAGVGTIKRWLEATTYIELPFDAYHHVPECTVLHLAGAKKFDLAGHYLDGHLDPIVVECKRYASPGRQYQEFRHFVAIAYSAALKDLELYKRVRKRHYVWVTYHPFNLDRWKHLETYQEMQKALHDFPEYLGGAAIDLGILNDVAGRVMVLVFNPKQEGLSLTRKELQAFRGIIDRKVDSI